jgi:predicted kinase
MPKLIITRGIPGCGKTTRAHAWVAEDPENRARINRDDLRAMGHQSKHVQKGVGPGTERAIVIAQHAAIGALLRAGVDVICDDMNLRQRTARELYAAAQLAGAEFEVWDLTYEPLQVCLDRNARREGVARLDDDVIVDLHRRYVAPLNGKPLPGPQDEAAPPDEVVPYVAAAGTPTAVMVDVDGTVALHGTRSPYDETQVHLDRPNRAAIEAVRAMHIAGHTIVYCSGRTSGCRDATEKWLADHVGVPHAGLFMRTAGDMRKDYVVKREMFDLDIRDQYDVLFVLDDRQQVVDGWRAIGLNVFQVAPGQF